MSATPRVTRQRPFHDNIEQWDGEVGSPFDAEVYRFHIAAAEARERMRGG